MDSPDPDATSRPRLAYLTGAYPAVSHTFILREVEGLRDLGLEVLPCSIRRTPPEQRPGPAEAAEAARTFHVLEAAKRPATLLAAQAAGLRNPGRYIRTLALALKTARPGLKGFLWQLFYFAEATVLARHLQDQGVDHLHNHFADSSANVAMLATALAKIGFSYTLHGPAEIYDPEGWHFREKTAQARFVFCISHFARSQAMLFSDPAHWPKLKIIHCGVTPERYGAQAETSTEGLHLVFVGRLVPIKGLRVLMEAFAAAREKVPGLRLTLVGDGADRAHLETLAAPYGEDVRFTGYLDQDGVAATLSQADALVLPSFAEGVPVVLMEAMASGKPVIATQVGGVSELVEDGVSGFVVPPGDPESLTHAISALADPEARARMGQAGRTRVLAEFDIRQEAARIAALLTGQGGDGIRPDPLPLPHPEPVETAQCAE
jgi:glycosyltransferase involved in cell wall biosynthesis